MGLSCSDLVDRLEQDEPFYFAWSLWPSPEAAEMMARSAFDAVLVDLQHGLADLSDAQGMIGNISLAGKPALVRIPVGDFASASRALDFGAQAIIAPMVNNGDDAKALVAAVKYPPLGARSYGPFRACQIFGLEDANAYVEIGNRSCLALAMIETQEALDHLDDILAVEGIDGVFVGPADMSLSLLNGKKVDMDHRMAVEALEHVAKCARSEDKIAGIYAPNADYAKRFAVLGYGMIAIGADMSFLAEGMVASLNALAR